MISPPLTELAPESEQMILQGKTVIKSNHIDMRNGRELPSQVKGAGLRLLSLRSSWVRIPPPALLYSVNHCKFPHIRLRCDVDRRQRLYGRQPVD
jgi:hypothetical protein